MAFLLTSRIEIGKYKFNGGFNNLKIRKSVDAVTQTASMQVPGVGTIMAVPPGKGPEPTEPTGSVQSANLFKEGDFVKIELGYNHQYNNEFEGFIIRVSPIIPILIEMEGYTWQLRKKNIMASWKSVTLRTVLEEIIKGTDIVLSKLIPTLTLTNFGIHDLNGVAALEKLKDKIHCKAIFRDKVLYVGLEQLNAGATVKYRFGWNTLNPTDLKYKYASDEKIKVRVVQKLPKGDRLLYEVGDNGGSIHNIRLYHLTSAEDVKKIGDEALLESKYTGYKGDLDTFLQPYAEPGDYANITDPKTADRDGTYFIRSVETTYGMAGARRRLSIGRKVS